MVLDAASDERVRADDDKQTTSKLTSRGLGAQERAAILATAKDQGA
jgi:hypothetical protein